MNEGREFEIVTVDDQIHPERLDALVKERGPRGELPQPPNNAAKRLVDSWARTEKAAPPKPSKYGTGRREVRAKAQARSRVGRFHVQSLSNGKVFRGWVFEKRAPINVEAIPSLPEYAAGG